MIPYKLQPRRLIGHITSPRVLVTSVPKAGTHLLTRTLTLFPQLRPGDAQLVDIPREEVITRLQRVKRGQFVSMHYGPWPKLDELLDQKDFKVLFICRDPRAICVSYVHWVMYIDKQSSHRPYLAALPDDDARLMAVIAGEAVKAKRPGMIDINTVMRRRLPWRSHPRCCTVTFETLVGSKGGSDDGTQQATVRQIAKHLDLTLTEKDLQFITDNVFSKTTTFRRGQIRDWTNHFKPAHKELFKSIAGQLLIDLGYEKGFHW